MVSTCIFMRDYPKGLSCGSQSRDNISSMVQDRDIVTVED